MYIPIAGSSNADEPTAARQLEETVAAAKRMLELEEEDETNVSK